VLSGFTSGAAIIIMGSQLKHLLRINMSGACKLDVCVCVCVLSHTALADKLALTQATL
jgi:MFS superfamily sulfate permease-like transporter